MLFPTRIKIKISSARSYPVGAELISSELADVPQASSLKISFHDKYERIKSRGKPYSIFEVSYHGVEDPDAGWSIKVHPVPRTLKHEVRKALIGEYFPRMREWLKENAALNHRYGERSLLVILDEKGTTLLKLEEYRDPEAFSN